MDTKRALIFLAAMIVVLIVVTNLFLKPSAFCCTPTRSELTATSIMAQNQVIGTYLAETAAASTVYPYEPTLYAERRQQERDLQTAAGPTEYAAFYGTESALIATYQGTVVPIETATATPNTATATLCSWQWATQELPAQTSAAQDALVQAGIEPTSLRAAAYGESCGSGFAAITTDFYLTLEVDDLTDDTLAAKVIAIYGALNTLSNLPAKAGYLDMTFQSDAEEKHIRTMFYQIQSALDKSLTGSALILAISSH